MVYIKTVGSWSKDIGKNNEIGYNGVAGWMLPTCVRGGKVKTR
jgi:hypothetical protein